MKSFRNATIKNYGAGISDAAIASTQGNYKVDSGPGEVRINGDKVVSTFARVTKMRQVLADDFDTVKGHKNTYVGEDYTIRVDGRFNIIVGNTDAKRSIQQEWLDTTAELAAARAAGEVKRGFTPIGQTAQEKKEGTHTSNPLLKSEFISTNSISQGLESIGESTKAKRTGSKTEISKWGKLDGNTPSTSPSTAGGSFEKTEVDIQQLHIETQKKLTKIERNMPRNELPIIADNIILGTAGPPNTRPPGRMDPIGRLERKGLKVYEGGPATDYTGVPHYEEVDNFSDIPFGNLNLKIGNKLIIEVGNGGIDFITGGSVKLIGGANTILGGEQVLIAGKGNVRINSKKHISITSDNIDFKSSNPITLDSLHVANNMIIGGGLYVNGELGINHITAPREWQKTNVEPEQTHGETITGVEIGEVKIDGTTYPVYGTGKPDSIKVYKHIHWFENLPLTLTNSNNDMRKSMKNINNYKSLPAKPAKDR